MLWLGTFNGAFSRGSRLQRQGNCSGLCFIDFVTRASAQLVITRQGTQKLPIEAVKSNVAFHD